MPAAIGVAHKLQIVVGIEDLVGEEEGDRGEILADFESPVCGKVPYAIKQADIGVAAAGAVLEPALSMSPLTMAPMRALLCRFHCRSFMVLRPNSSFPLEFVSDL